MRRRLTAGLVVSSASLLAVMGTATAAHADPADKPQVLSSWTQTSAGSQSAFLSARANQGSWAAYNFDWSTDVCSSSPDNPFGFPFENGCFLVTTSDTATTRHRAPSRPTSHGSTAPSTRT